jgi:hypothetical protein
LDAKERLYLILKHYDWLSEFFRFYPLHFYENSFQFVDRIPEKKLPVKVKVIGLGIGGSMALSGLAKAGVSSVVGYEKRNESGPRSVGSRYQNASWRAYDVAEKLLDDEAYQHLIAYRQQFNVPLDDGTSKIITSDRVQIILGSAIESAQASARRYGARLVFGSTDDDICKSTVTEEEVDLVALFTGAHTVKMFDGLEREMGVYQWEGLRSECDMWLSIKPSAHQGFYCTRSGEVGAERWHYTIESARDTVDDITRVQNCLAMQLDAGLRMATTDAERAAITAQVEGQRLQLQRVAEYMEATNGGRFDYIFTNAPVNEHNRRKRDKARADGSIVLEGGYAVDLTFAPNCAAKSDQILSHFNAKTVIMGGDACVAPNPQAAYGATLACVSADMVVQLAVTIGHLNAIVGDLDTFDPNHEWKHHIEELKGLFVQYFEARSQSENYFQWVQTLICNVYSIPPVVP